MAVDFVANASIAADANGNALPVSFANGVISITGATVATPEPSTAAVLLVGLLGLGLERERRRRNRPNR